MRWGFLLSCLLVIVFSADIVNLDVPMIHQVWDVPAWYNGDWGCGPTSTVMAISYYKKLAPFTINCPLPDPHTNDYGWYLPNNYSINGFEFDTMDYDASHHPAWGAYGFCTLSGGAWANLCQTFVEKHDLIGKFNDTSTFDMVKAALDAGHPVILDTRLTSAGHIINIRGYDSDGNMIVNDPYGNAHSPSTYGKKRDGQGVRYTFDFVKAHWMIEVSLP